MGSGGFAYTRVLYRYIHVREEEEEEKGFRTVKALTLERHSFSRSLADMRAGYSLSGPFSAVSNGIHYRK